MSPAAWTAVSGIAIALIGALGAILVELVRNRRATERAEAAAAAAEVNTKPVSNGAIPAIQRTLNDLVERLGRVEERVDQRDDDITHRLGRIEGRLARNDP